MDDGGAAAARVEDRANDDDVSSANGVVDISIAVEEGARVDDGGAAAA